MFGFSSYRAAIALALTGSALLWSPSDASPCDYQITCSDERYTYAPCSPADVAEFQLVAPALQACQDISYYFIDGSQWPFLERPRFCDPQSACGRIIPYARNVRDESAMCQTFKPFARVLKTFRHFCRGEPIMDIQSGDNGLLEELKASKNKPKPTPARSRPAPVPAPIPIPNTEVLLTPSPSPSPLPVPVSLTPTVTEVAVSTPAPVNTSAPTSTPAPPATQPSEKPTGAANARTQSLASTTTASSLVAVALATAINLIIAN
ncbi:hypothetical protein PINS_up019303 [Pythium insidiosum]|nr:hypothetical protein PINS_up019303 [Pythium insidiosum]